MAFQNPKLLVGEYVAAADLSGLQFTYVGLDGSGGVVSATAAAQTILGILQDTPAQGEVCTIANGGVSKLVMSGAVAEGVFVTAAAGGEGAAAATTEPYFGQTLSASAGAGEIVEVDLDKNGVLP
jgi:hypothetical protein